MNKPQVDVYEKFLTDFNRLNNQLGKKQYIIPYFIASHPGCTIKEMVELAMFLQKIRFVPDQVQDFLPTPMTSSTCMYYTELDLDGNQIFVPKSDKDRQLQRKILHFHKKENRRVFEQYRKKYFGK